ncbi:hypothetical protein PUN28_000885 [Cardiocondyla obscurior]|uniref:Secreted protein n=1 Tax=Cardiocondyla obscurior TaxID=286306 RepID=A0AAW2H1I6_9HYME
MGNKARSRNAFFLICRVLSFRAHTHCSHSPSGKEKTMLGAISLSTFRSSGWLDLKQARRLRFPKMFGYSGCRDTSYSKSRMCNNAARSNLMCNEPFLSLSLYILTTTPLWSAFLRRSSLVESA